MGPRRRQHRPLWHLPQPVDARLRLPQDVRRHPQWQPEYGSAPPSWGDPLVLFGPLDWTGAQHCSWDGPNQKACNNHRYEEGLIHLVHQAGGEIYPSIGGWTLSDNFPAVAASATARTNFANQCVELIKDYGFE